MNQPRTGFTKLQGADARVAEEVQDIGVAGALAHPVPLRRHVREECKVTERGEGGVEAHRAARQLPSARHRAMLDPAATALLVRAWNEGRVRIPVAEFLRPHRLGFRADHLVRAVTLELAASAAIDQAPVLPRLGDNRREVAHAASASLAPTAATARGPAS